MSNYYGKNYTIEDFKKKFYSMIKHDETGCWVFQGYKNDQGYGKIVCKKFFHREQLAHRISYLLHNSTIPLKGQCVLHKCDNPSCVNPSHFFVGDRDLNNKDRAKKGRSVTPTMNLTHCKRGHEFTLENTIIRNTGTRLCRTCVNVNTKNRYHKNKKSVLNTTKSLYD